MTPAQALRRLRAELGLAGSVGLLMGAAALAFFAFAVRPLEQRSLALDQELAQRAPLAPQSDPKLVLVSSPAAKLAASRSTLSPELGAMRAKSPRHHRRYQRMNC